MEAPEAITVPGTSVAGSWTAAKLASTANKAVTGIAYETVDGVRPVSADRILLTGQTTGSQNGIYIAGVTGSELSPGGKFSNPAGTATATLSNTKSYYWSKGASTTSLVYSGGTIIASGWFYPEGDGGNITLHGTPDEDVLDSIKEVTLTRATDADASGEFVRHKTVAVTHGTANAGRTFRYDGKASPTVGTDALTFVAGPQAITVP